MVSRQAAPANSADPPPEPIRVIVADTQSIFRVGMRRIFAVEEDLRVVGQAETLGQVMAAVQRYPANILMYDVRIAPDQPEAISEVLKKVPELKVVTLVPEVTEEVTVEYLRRGVRGIVTRSVPPEMLVRCIRRVAAGETWLDHRSVNWVIDAYRAQAALLTTPRARTRLTDKELLIVSCLTRGMKNKEIAQEVGTTEQVVKNYLRKVYDKLGVSDRLELALYCVHHRLLEGVRPPSEERAEAAAAAAAIPPPAEAPKS